jgi:hypothetical protein
MLMSTASRFSVVYTLPFENPNYAQPQALRTYLSDVEGHFPCTIWQAARATSAATTFFDPVEIGKPPNPKKYIDAGIKFNNPSKALKTECGNIWGDVYGRMDPNEYQIACFLSIGTGFSKIARMDAVTLKQKISEKFQVPLAAVEVMKNIVSDTETTNFDLGKEFTRGIYHRFNVEQGLQEVELFEFEKIASIRADTNDYLTRKWADLGDCVTQMAKLVPNLEPLAEHSDEAEMFGKAESRKDTDLDLKQRLEGLRM